MMARQAFSLSADSRNISAQKKWDHPFKQPDSFSCPDPSHHLAFQPSLSAHETQSTTSNLYPYTFALNIDRWETSITYSRFQEVEEVRHVSMGSRMIKYLQRVMLCYATSMRSNGASVIHMAGSHDGGVNCMDGCASRTAHCPAEVPSAWHVSRDERSISNNSIYIMHWVTLPVMN